MGTNWVGFGFAPLAAAAPLWQNVSTDQGYFHGLDQTYAPFPGFLPLAAAAPAAPPAL